MNVFGTDQNLQDLEKELEERDVNPASLQGTDERPYLDFLVSAGASNDNSYDIAVDISFKLFESLFAPEKGRLDDLMPAEFGCDITAGIATGAWEGQSYGFHISPEGINEIRANSETDEGYDRAVMREMYEDQTTGSLYL